MTDIAPALLCRTVNPGPWVDDPVTGGKARWYGQSPAGRHMLAATARQLDDAYVASAWGFDKNGDPERVIIFREQHPTLTDAIRAADEALRRSG